jgi:DUF438 domain-containing protein
MEKHAWYKVFPGAITVTDAEGTVIEMNEGSEKLFEKDGGYAVMGRNAITCHPARVQEKVRRIYEDHQFNIYSIKKNGKKHLVYQAPYFFGDEFGGIVELFLELPEHIPHFDRDNPENNA